MKLVIAVFAVLMAVGSIFADDRAKIQGKETIMYKNQDGAKVKGILSDGETVTILSRDKDRSWVKNYFGAKGWVSNENLMLAKFESFEKEVKVVKNDQPSDK